MFKFKGCICTPIEAGCLLPESTVLELQRLKKPRYLYMLLFGGFVFNFQFLIYIEIKSSVIWGGGAGGVINIFENVIVYFLTAIVNTFSFLIIVPRTIHSKIYYKYIQTCPLKNHKNMDLIHNNWWSKRL